MATPSKTGDKPVKAPAKSAAKPKAAKATTAATVAKKPAVKKPAAPKTSAAKKPAVAASKPATAAKASGRPKLTPDQRRYYVEVAAYYIAERRGFHGGSQMDDWVEAEAEIDRLVREGILKP